LYNLRSGIKGDAQKFWSLTDRIFFGYGACHILAGAYLLRPPLSGFYAERIIPFDGHWGNHVYLTNGTIAFDHHGYSARDHLLKHHRKGWSVKSPGWDFVVERADFDLLSTPELNARKMRGPDQYLLDPVPRAQRFIERFDHLAASAKAAMTLNARPRPA
jgi:hypothetical protein